jgi:hypothetical protein
MPMIDVYSATGTFADKRTLAKDLAAAVMRWEQVRVVADARIDRRWQAARQVVR